MARKQTYYSKGKMQSKKRNSMSELIKRVQEQNDNDEAKRQLLQIKEESKDDD